MKLSEDKARIGKLLMTLSKTEGNLIVNLVKEAEETLTKIQLEKLEGKREGINKTLHAWKDEGTTYIDEFSFDEMITEILSIIKEALEG